ncbi:endonuclease/exonuclease/phosphatase family protein [Propylenella binzhouense]|uniref:Endonuclease n=1 Tax=Propylenella binzhouense TaxID=2555902 RepID=A0A964T911_9HYPH|nr:endonuclease [Propylenella binzhouense]
MRIATFNTENLGEGEASDEADRRRIAILRPQLLRLEADVVCLQEVNAPRDPDGIRRLSLLDALLAGTPYAAFHRAASTRPGAGGPAGGPMDRHNLVVLSRWPISAQRQVFHDFVPPVPHAFLAGGAGAAGADGAIRWDRPLLHVEIAVPGGRRLHVLDLHLRAPLAAPVPGQKTGPFAWASVSGWAEGYFIASVKRSGQALEARLLVERILDAEPEALVVVAGDFNAETGEAPTRILLADIEDTGNGALAGRSLVPLERSLPESQRFSVIHGGRRMMLDHLLASRPLLALYRGLEIHNEALGDELVARSGVRDSPESYHAPVVATFALPETPEQPS